MKRYIFYIITALYLCSCVKYNLNEILLEQSDISLSIKGRAQYTFNPTSGQMAFNSEKTLYRYMDDNMNSWFELQCQSKPGGTADKVIADLKWKSKISSGDEKDLEFDIKQTDDKGTIWMWNDTNNIGLIIREFD